MDPKSLGKKIKIARVEQDLNQTEFAKKIGANQKSVSRYENGLSIPTLETICRPFRRINIYRDSVGEYIEFNTSKSGEV